jgi:putative redox protein
MRKTVAGFDVHAKGVRREQHPTSFETISLQFTLRSPDVEDGDIEKAVRLSEETYCPVWDMLKNNVEVTSRFSVIK